VQGGGSVTLGRRTELTRLNPNASARWQNCEVGPPHSQAFEHHNLVRPEPGQCVLRNASIVGTNVITFWKRKA
jgi:hypothetical protein